MSFDQDPPELDGDIAAYNHGSMARCGCGEIYSVEIPCICKCGKAKLYWRMLDGKIKKLSEMDLGHLTNIVRMIASKIEKYSMGSEERNSREIALDLIYAEISSRDKEINQLTSIMNALTRNRTPADAD